MSQSGDLLDPVDRLAGEFLERRRRGEKPTIDEYAERHPDLAEKIREVLAALLLIEDYGAVEEDRSRPIRGEAEDVIGELRELGNYRLIRRIGRGGMGVVYEAEQMSLGRRVALKILPFHSLLAPDHLRRFQLEARAAARLHHPNIVPIYEVGEAGGVHYYAMQLIQGRGLDEVLAEIKRLGVVGRAAPPPGERLGSRSESESRAMAMGLISGTFRPSSRPSSPRVGEGNDSPAAEAESAPTFSPAEGSSSTARLPGQRDGEPSTDGPLGYCRSIALIGVEAADALAHAHAAGVLHRDVKPSNLLLDLEGTVWVTDFGLAKTTEGAEHLTHTGHLVGTLRYMGPERFQGWSDPRSDVYGLGVTLYELLTMRPVFSAPDRATLVREILYVEPTPPRRLDRHIPRDLETIVLKAIAKEPAKRYPSAAELADDLRCFLEDRPIVARRTSPRERMTLWFRRNRLAGSLIAAVGAILVVAAIVAGSAAVHLGRLARDLQVEQKATLANLRKASLEEARARRLSRRVGQRHRSLEALARAAAIEPGADLRELRRELAALGLDWSLPPYPERPAARLTAPRAATVLLGELAPAGGAERCLRGIIERGARAVREVFAGARGAAGE